MRKGNIIIIAILLLVSFELIWLWNFLGFSLHDPIDLTIAIVWWVVLIAVVVAIVVVEQRRRARIRTIFVADDCLYNCETGVVRLPGGDSDRDYVKSMRNILSSINYKGEAKLSQDQPRVRFNYIVRTKKYSDGGRVWSGEVVNINGSRHPMGFSSAQDLMKILAA